MIKRKALQIKHEYNQFHPCSQNHSVNRLIIPIEQLEEHR